jgi:hypothetical protein
MAPGLLAGEDSPPTLLNLSDRSSKTKAKLIANATRLNQFQCVITGFLEATNKLLEEQNEQLQITKRSLSTELARTRPATKPPSDGVFPYLGPRIPRKK